MSKPKIYTVKGYTGTLYQICTKLGLPYITVCRRIRKGVSVEEALSNPVVSKNNHYEVYTVGGFTGNISQICSHFKVSDTVVRRRMRGGMSIEEAIKIPPRNIPEYTIDEFTGNIADICRHFEVDYVLVNRRIQKGMTLEEAIKSPVRKPKTFTVNGFTGSVTEVCRRFGLNLYVIEARLRKGMSIDEAINIPLARIRSVYEYNGLGSDLRGICKLENKDYIEVYNLLKSCHTLEYALQNAPVGYSEE